MFEQHSDSEGSVYGSQLQGNHLNPWAMVSLEIHMFSLYLHDFSSYLPPLRKWGIGKSRGEWLWVMTWHPNQGEEEDEGFICHIYV